MATPKKSEITSRPPVRLLTASLAALAAVIYALIGMRVLTVLETPSDQTAFGFMAASAFALAPS